MENVCTPIILEWLQQFKDEMKLYIRKFSSGIIFNEISSIVFKREGKMLRKV